MKHIKLFEGFINENMDPSVLLRILLEEFKANGIKPIEVYQPEMESDAGCNIDDTYSIQIAEYENKPYSLWKSEGSTMEEVVQKKTCDQIVKEYLKRVKKITLKNY